LTYSTSSATTLGLAPATATVSTDAITTDNVTVTLEDSTANTVPAGTSAYVTFTLSGPALFAQTGTNTLSAYVPSGSTGYTLAVNSEQGVNGSISISASATGLATASATISAVTTTAASKIAVAKTTGTTSYQQLVNGAELPVGTTYTEYTVQLEDSNGYAVTGAGALTISDNTATTGGVIEYFTGLGSADLSAITVTSGSFNTTLNAANGSYSFYVLNAATAATNPTITVDDTTLSYSTTATYTFVTAAAAKIAFTTPSYNQTVEPGASVTYTVQEEDVSGNALSLANQAVTFSIANTTGCAATVDNCSTYVAYTNASGLATVTVAIPSTSLSGGYTLSAVGASTITSSGLLLSSLANYATAVGVSSSTSSYSAITWPTSASAGADIFVGNSIPHSYVYALNSLNGFVGTNVEELQISSSNQGVIETGSGAATETVTSGTDLSASTATELKAIAAGTATITIKDLSNPTAPSITETITVSAGTPSAVKVINPDSTTAANYTFPSAGGVSGAFTINLVDAGGNIVPATAPLTLTFDQVLYALGAATNTTGAAAEATGIRTTATGSDVSSVTFAQGQSTMTVYLDNYTASAVTSDGSAPTALTTIAPLTITGSSISGKVITLTTSNPVATGLTTASFTASGSVTISAVAVNGNTITITFTGTAAIGNTITTAASFATGYSATLASGALAYTFAAIA
jgi:hypothetical protein